MSREEVLSIAIEFLNAVNCADTCTTLVLMAWHIAHLEATREGSERRLLEHLDAYVQGEKRR